MEKILKFDFYQVVMPEEERSPFESILKVVNDLDGTARTYDNGEYHVRLVGLVQRPGYFLGDIARIRMNDIPDKMKLSGEREIIELDDDQGLGEITSFIYNPALRALAFMRNRLAVTATGFANYFQNLGRIQGVLFLQHLLEVDAYQRLTRMNIVHKVEIAFAAPGNGAIFDNLGLRPQTIADLINVAPKVKMDFTISMDRERNLTLPLQSIRNLVGIFTGEYSEQVTKLVVSGKENPEQRLDAVDMLEEIMTDKVPVTIRRNQRAITDQQRHHAIEQSYLRKVGDLNRILRDE